MTEMIFTHNSFDHDLFDGKRVRLRPGAVWGGRIGIVRKRPDGEWNQTPLVFCPEDEPDEICMPIYSVEIECYWDDSIIMQSYFKGMMDRIINEN